jgi:phenylacetic acid degradation operon negative regulatory protein
MAGNRVRGGQLAQDRLLGRAAAGGPRAPGTEPAAARRMHRRRRLAPDRPDIPGTWFRARVFVHAMPAPSDRLPGPVTATFGVGVEGALAAAAIVTGGVAEKHPDLRLAFSHAAGGFPLMLPRAQWFWGRTWNEEPPAERGPEPWGTAETGPIELARRFWYDSLVFDRRAIRYLVDMLGADRLLVGSDFPAMPREEPCGRTLRSLGLPDAAVAHITWHNAFRFLGVDPKLSSTLMISTAQTAQRPPRLLLTLLGDYWWQRTEPLPTAAIVALLAEFGVTGAAARAALSRLTRGGLLIASKTGRRTHARLSPRAAAILDDGAHRIFSFGAVSEPWDGLWSLVAFSIPEDNRAARDALRKQLRWLGFAPLYDGLWVSPRDHAAEVIGQLKDLGIATATAFRAASVPGGCASPARAWDLDGLRARYEHFTGFAGELRDTAAAGRISPEAALIARTAVMDEWRAFPGLDPDLPAELLPGRWPRPAARELFIACYDLLGPPAAQRVREVIGRYSPELASLAAYHSSELKLSAAPAAGTRPAAGQAG